MLQRCLVDPLCQYVHLHYYYSKNSSFRCFCQTVYKQGVIIIPELNDKLPTFNGVECFVQETKNCKRHAIPDLLFPFPLVRRNSMTTVHSKFIKALIKCLTI